MEPAAESRRGRPSVRPGEPSLDVHLTIEVSLHRALRRLAQARREDVTEVMRVALRAFMAEKLTNPEDSP